VKSELQKHLTPLLAIFIVVSIFWLFQKAVWYHYIFLFFGFFWGAFFLDLDHLIYWLYMNPNTEESRLAKIAIFKYDVNSVIKLFESTHKNHTNLIFHHFFFQVVLALISLFVFTSSSSPFAMAFLLALNIHLLVDEIDDYRHDKSHLQDWLFARESKQLPLDSLNKYIGIFLFLSSIFTILLLRSAK